nr:IclR family transcriptional regulator C-terminal domain-containing protein [Bradyrhizobium neotropicale]
MRDLTGETAYLAVQEGHHVLSLGRFESAHSERSSARLGALKPMHCTSQGKAILAHLSDAQVELALRDGLGNSLTRRSAIPSS